MKYILLILSLLFFQQISNTQVPSIFIKGLVAHYPLNEGAGLTAFPKQCVHWAAISTCTWVQSPLGKCLNWAGPTTNNVTLGKLSNLNLQGQMTIVRIGEIILR